MTKVEVAEAIAKRHEVSQPVLYRLFTQSEYVASIVKGMNRWNESCVEQLRHPAMRDAVYVAAIYPAIKWMVDFEKEEEGFLTFLERGSFCASEKMAQMLHGQDSSSFTEKRKRYIESCRNFVSKIEDFVEKIGSYPVYGGKYQETLRCVLGMRREGFSRYNINKYLTGALGHLGVCVESGRLLDGVLTGAYPSDEESAAFQRSMQDVLFEYTRILWLSRNMGEDDYAQKYLETMNRAIEHVKLFPGGSCYHDILITMIQLKPLGISDEVAAERLDISTYTYSIKKRRAFIILASLLFYVNGDTFLKVLCDKA